MVKLEFDNKNLFIDELTSKYKTQFFFVGGCVRDMIIGKPSKDIDLIIPHISVNDLGELLSNYGKCEMVGESFPVFKFFPHGFTGSEPIDVTVPRIERSNGIGHKDFDVIFDTSVTLEDDLSRRDFTMNALALDINGNIIDLFNGISDIRNKIIRVINDNSFKDDALRILRCVQFASRFNFTIDDHSKALLYDSAELLNSVSTERIREEIIKGLKGNRIELSKYLVSIFECKGITSKYKYFTNINKLNYAEYIHFIGLPKKLAYFTSKESLYYDSINELYNNSNVLNEITLVLKYKMLKEIVLSDYLETITDGKYIDIFNRIREVNLYNVNDLLISGNFLLSLGENMSGINVGKIKKFLLMLVLSGDIKNDPNELIEYSGIINDNFNVMEKLFIKKTTLL